MIDTIVNFIKHHQKFVILGHIAPDGDCVGSQMSLQLFLTRLGKEVGVASKGPFNKNEVKEYAHLFMHEIDEHWQDAAVIIVDCATFERTGFEAFGVAAISIDHHSNIESGYIEGFLDINAPSCTLLVQQVLEACDLTINEAEAAWLFLGFATDTGFFRHLRVGSAQYLHQAARLVAYGVSPAQTYAKLERGYSLRDRQYLGALMANSRSYLDEQVILVEDKGFDDAMDCPSRDSDTLYRLLLSANKTEVVIVVRMDSDQITVGFRSRNVVDVGAIAQGLGGGGHMRASGCIVSRKDFTPEALKEYILQAISQQLSSI